MKYFILFTFNAAEHPVDSYVREVRLITAEKAAFLLHCRRPFISSVVQRLTRIILDVMPEIT